MVLKQFVLRVGAVLVAGTCLSAVAAVSEQDAAKLGTVLSPVGAEKAGNADGSIPAWTGAPLQTPAGWTLGQPRPDPYANESRYSRLTRPMSTNLKTSSRPARLR